MSEEKCVVCADIIPEGRQVCPNCNTKEPKIENLKPCPFCGHKNPMLWDERKSGKGFEITCRMCAAKVGGNRTEKEAIEAWNRREEPK